MNRDALGRETVRCQTELLLDVAAA